MTDAPVPVEPPDCSACKHHEQTSLFTLCKHKQSEYVIDGETARVQFHTIGHMRSERRGVCVDGALFEAKES